jgi:hypothetical protein
MKHRVSKCRPLSSQFASATRFIASAVSPEALGLGHGRRIRECKGKTTLQFQNRFSKYEAKAKLAVAPGITRDSISKDAR